MQRIKKGDKVVVITGKNKGGSGIVLKIMPARQQAIVEGLNKVTRHKKKDQTTKRAAKQSTGKVQQEAPIFLSKLALFDQKAKQQTIGKIKYFMDPKTNKKTRVFKKSNNTL